MIAAERIRETLLKAMEEKHYKDAWYAYVRRTDVETLVEAVLGPYPVEEPEEVEPETYTLTITDGVGNVVRTVEVERDDFETLTADTRTFTTGIGQTLKGVHPPEVCAGRYCVIHNPGPHHMREWPTCWRPDRGIMERICEHGVGHPDPDDQAFLISQGRTHEGVHGCDGCCHPDHVPGQEIRQVCMGHEEGATYSLGNRDPLLPLPDPPPPPPPPRPAHPTCLEQSGREPNHRPEFG
jgi:hypothetical protein